MSIYNKTYIADEEITYSSLNQISADANNSVADIHPQYGWPSYYSKADHYFGFQVTDGQVDYYSVQSGLYILSFVRYYRPVAGGAIYIPIAKLNYKKKSSLVDPGHVQINMKVQKSGVTNPCVSGVLLVNGTRVDSILTEVTVATPSFQTIAETLDIGALLTDDVVEITLSMQNTPSGASYCMCNEIEVYFSV